MTKHSFLYFGLFLLSLAACAGSEDISSEPATESITGVVRMVTENEGTFSEIRYFTLHPAGEKQVILFNSRGFSLGFDDWLGKTVEIRYLQCEGKIGPRRRPAQGIEVLEIQESN